MTLRRDLKIFKWKMICRSKETLVRIAAKKLREAGLNALPAKDKRPLVAWKQYTKEPCTIWRADAEMVGVVCGAVSGNLQVLDFDLQAVKFDEWKRRAIDFGGEVARAALEQVLIERSKSGGKHVAYRIDAAVAGNQKLCDTANGCAIETRGEGGFVVCAPTPGYEVEQGDWLKLPTLSHEVDELFLTAARSLSEIKKEAPTFSPSGFSGLDVADELREQGVEEVLTRHGWTYVKEYNGDALWRRPGKDYGVSGVLHPETQMFYVYTSNAAPLEPGQTYTPLQLIAALEYGGDQSEAARDHARDLPDILPDVAVGSVTQMPEFPRELLNVPGTIGEMTAFVESVAKRSQPALSFAASLATFGHLLARRVALGGSLDTSPACWIIAISPPSSGKGAGLYVARLLTNLSDDDDLASEYESVQVFIDSIASTGKQFLLQDEFGSWLTEANSDRASSCKRRLLECWLQIFSAYNVEKFQLPASLRRGKQPPMNRPAFSLYGVTNFADIQTGLTGKLLKNGFVARTLFVVGDSKARYDFGKEEQEVVMPPTLEASWQEWLKFRPPTDLNIADPLRVPIDKDASKRLIEYGMECDAKYLEIDDANLAIKTAEGRAYEKARKYALIFGCSKFGAANPHVDLESAELAIKLSRYERNIFLYLTDNVIAETEEERFVNEVVRWLSSGVKTFGMPEITKIVKNKAMRDAVLDDLVSRGYISVELVTIEGQRRPKKVFKSNL